MRRILIPALFCAVALPSLASADDWRTGSDDRALLDSLSPSMREHVMMRMGPEQRIPELVETTILNQLAQKHNGVRHLQRFGDDFTAEVLTAEGDWEPVTIDTTTWDISG